MPLKMFKNRVGHDNGNAAGCIKKAGSRIYPLPASSIVDNMF